LNHLSELIDASGKSIVNLRRGQRLVIPTQARKRSFLSGVEKVPDVVVSNGGVSTAVSVDTRTVNLSCKTEDEEKTKVTLGQYSERDFTSRVITQSDLGERDDSLALRLEIQIDGRWSPIVEYVVTEHASFVRAHTANGRQSTITIDLPTRTVRELAENDLTANAEAYRERYMSGYLPF
jgi:hypothetical protein